MHPNSQGRGNEGADSGDVRNYKGHGKIQIHRKGDDSKPRRETHPVQDAGQGEEG